MVFVRNDDKVLFIRPDFCHIYATANSQQAVSIYERAKALEVAVFWELFTIFYMKELLGIDIFLGGLDDSILSL